MKVINIFERNVFKSMHYYCLLHKSYTTFYIIYYVRVCKQHIHSMHACLLPHKRKKREKTAHPFIYTEREITHNHYYVCTIKQIVHVSVRSVLWYLFSVTAEMYTHTTSTQTPKNSQPTERKYIVRDIILSLTYLFLTHTLGCIFVCFFFRLCCILVLISFTQCIQMHGIPTYFTCACVNVCCVVI